MCAYETSAHRKGKSRDHWGWHDIQGTAERAGGTGKETQGHWKGDRLELRHDFNVLSCAKVHTPQLKQCKGSIMPSCAQT